MPNRGNFHLIQQSMQSLLSGGAHAIQAVTTDLSAKPVGYLVMFDTDGNLVVSSVIAASISGGHGTHAEILMDSSGPILESGGGYIYVTGVPD